MVGGCGCVDVISVERDYWCVLVGRVGPVGSNICGIGVGLRLCKVGVGRVTLQISAGWCESLFCGIGVGAGVGIGLFGVGLVWIGYGHRFMWV